MERAGVGRLAHKMSMEDRNEVSAIVGRLKRVVGADADRKIAKQADVKPQADVVEFPQEFYDFFKVDGKAS